MDPGVTLVNWQQAFESYRMPQTRAVEKQLRSSAAQNKEKLRTLVGGSYRELLATAQAIVVLDEKTRVVEDQLSSIGHNCRPPHLNATPKAPPADKTTLAQFRLLQRCCATIVSGLTNGNLLQCSRLVVVSRLLLKSLGDVEGAAKGLDPLRNRLTGLRRQLLQRVEAKLANPTSTLSELLGLICSYCLVTSTSADDGLAHLRQLRLEKLRRQLRDVHHQSAVCDGLRYQLSSLQTFKALFGRQLVEAMSDLQRKPILADPSIRNLESLDLDRIIYLVPSDIRTFVPYFKRVAPASEELRAKLEEWSREACQVLTDALRHCLSQTGQIDRVLTLRREVYALLLPSYFSTPAAGYVHENISQVINQRIQVICQTQAAQLAQTTSPLLEREETDEHAVALWDGDLALSSLDTGGNKFIRQVRNRHTGHNATLSKQSRIISRWVLAAKVTLGQLDELCKIRWRDILEDPDEEGEDEAVALTKYLGERDPKLYTETLQTSLRAAVLQHETVMAESAAKVANEGMDVSHAITLLRSIRLSMSCLQGILPEKMNFEKFQSTALELQQMVADEVSLRLSNLLLRSKGAGALVGSTYPENMPSPQAFSILRHLCRTMTDMGGTDLWSTPLVKMVKSTVTSQILDPEHKARFLCHEFDEAYISIALDHTSAGTQQETAKSKATAKSASEYWTRTRLLFGVL